MQKDTKECNNECPFSCEYYYYDSRVSSKRFPSTSFAKLLRNSTKTFVNSTVSEIKSSTFRLNVYFDYLGEEMMEEVAMYSLDCVLE